MQTDTTTLLIHLFLPLLLVVALLVYFKLAMKYKIIDKPNDRSSHIKPTIRGGGIIFPLAIAAFALFNSLAYPYFVLAVILSGGISFLDDIKDLPRTLRLGIHALAAGLVLFQAGIVALPVVLVILAFVFVVGVFNAYNFMDGINGITGLYSLAILLPLMLTENSDVNKELQYYVLISLVIFLFFNARKKAKCFAGDVGSVSIAVVICFMLVQRVVATGDYTYLGFLALYLVDTGATFIQRLIGREKVFEAHRKHLFQVLSNEMTMPHLVVATLFAVLQLGINLMLVNTNLQVPGLLLMFAVLFAIYIPLKFVLLKRYKKQPVSS